MQQRKWKSVALSAEEKIGMVEWFESIQDGMCVTIAVTIIVMPNKEKMKKINII